MPRRQHPPKLQHHKASGLGRVRDRGQDVYFSRYGTTACDHEYAAWKLEWYRRHAAAPPRVEIVAELIEVYVLAHGLLPGAKLEAYDAFKRKVMEHALAQPIAERWVHEIGPADLEAFADRLASLEVVTSCEKTGDVISRRPRYARKTVNKMTATLRRAVRWCERKGHVPVGTWHRLSAAEAIKPGESPARETEPVTPVAEELVEATLPHLPPVVADLVRFQLLVGCRPGEACGLRLSDVDTTGEVWLWTIVKHKTAHHGKARVIPIGPRAREIVRAQASHRLEDAVFRTPAGKAYRRDSYALAIRRACARAKLPHWTPNQLRHARATELRRSYGLDVASAVLGHSNLSTTQVYAEKRIADAMRAAAETG